MGIRFNCPNGHKLNVKSFLAGRTGFCPHCGVKVAIPMESTRGPGAAGRSRQEHAADATPSEPSTPPPMVGTFEPLGATPMPTPGVSRPTPAPGMMGAPFSGGGMSPVVPAMPYVAAAPTPSIPSIDFAAHMEALATSAAAAIAPPPLQTGPVDPISESPDAVWYIRPPSGGQFGPATGPVMRTWLQEGRVSADTLVWREGWADWQDAGRVFPQLQGPPSPLPAAAAPITPYSRQKRSSSRALHVGALLLVVVVLLVFLVWLLRREFTTQPPAAEHAAPTAQSASAPLWLTAPPGLPRPFLEQA